MLFAVSISLTRFVAAKSADVLARGLAISIALLATMAVSQYVLLALWSPLLGSVTGAIWSSIFGWPVLISQNGYLDVAQSWAQAVTAEIENIHLQSPQELLNAADYSFDTFGWLAQKALAWTFAARQFLWIFGVIPNLFRLLLAFVFLSSFLLKPLHSAILFLLRRIVESDKPIFTLVFGGAAALAKLIDAALKYLDSGAPLPPG